MGRRWTAFALAGAGLALGASPALGAAGDLDRSFGTGGRQTLIGVPETTLETVVQPDGKIVLLTDDGTDDVKLRRLNADGTPDQTFSGDAVTTIDFGGIDDGYEIAALPDGKLLVAGRTGANPALNIGIVLARLDAQGELDPTFSPGGADGDGKAFLPESTYLFPEATLLRAGGQIALGITDSTSKTFGVRLLDANGAPTAVTYAAAAFAATPLARAAANAPDGKIVVAARGFEDSDPASVARWSADGKLDAGFAGTGKRTLPALNDVTSVSALEDGRVVVVGSAPPPARGIVVVRLEDDGDADPTFGDGGIARVDFPGSDVPVGAGLQADGKLLLAAGALDEFVVGAARLTTAGRLDASYGSGGLAAPLAGQPVGAQAATLMPDGRMVIAGATLVLPTIRATVVRLLADPAPVTGGGAPVPGGDPGPTLDTRAPVLTGLKVTRTVAGKRPRIAFTLSEPARVQLVLKRRGRPARRFAANGLAGANRLRAPRRVERGRHRLTAIASDPAGNVGSTVRRRFTVRRSPGN